MEGFMIDTALAVYLLFEPLKIFRIGREQARMIEMGAQNTHFVRIHLHFQNVTTAVIA